MTRAYQEMYLSNAQSMLGEAFDYAMNDCHIPGDTFVKLFVASSVSKRMENGEPNFLAGKSGADISKFASILDARIRETFPDTNLRRIRRTYGCSQSELAIHSGVSLRSIQMYEQRNKDINKASAETLLKLSKALGCTMEDLIEK